MKSPKTLGRSHPPSLPRLHPSGRILLPCEPRRGSSHLESFLNSKGLNQHHVLFALRHATGNLQGRREVFGHSNDPLAVFGLHHQTMCEVVEGRFLDSLEDPMFILDTNQAGTSTIGPISVTVVFARVVNEARSLTGCQSRRRSGILIFLCCSTPARKARAMRVPSRNPKIPLRPFAWCT